ncbi:MAG: matrixin family metalloprotease [Bryobacteraceae bacterium]
MKRSFAIRLLGIAATAAMFASSASAYYFYVHYASLTGPFVYEKWDLTTLQNNTVYFYISDTGPQAMAPGDTFQAIVSEIRTAALEWNNVKTSAIKFAYGGLYTASASEVTTGITIEFSDELPPGVIALGGPISYAGPGNGKFVPILQSTVRIQSDLSQPSTACDNNPCPSYSEYFYTTMVHEFGHTVGLQHTFTSAAMSTYITSAATKASPLAVDDEMAISLLYPTKDFAKSVGTVTGTVTASGTGVVMASVVAIASGVPAVSTITNPDGTYSLTLPKGGYQMYVHPIPPPEPSESTPGNIIAPKDPDGDPMAFPASVFQTQFYDAGAGTQSYLQAATVYVNTAEVTSGVNFQVQSKPFTSISGVRTYGYLTNVPIASPPVSVSSRAAIVAYGDGLMQNNTTLVPGLSLSMLGSGSNNAVQVYDLQPYVDGYLSFAAAVGTFAAGPQHILFAVPGDIYVLPSAFKIVTASPPSITAVAPALDSNGNPVVSVSGANLTAGTTTILFDGLAGNVTGTANDGSLLVVPPAGSGSYSAAVTALNPDGQSSNFLAATPQFYTYGPSDPASLAVTPGTLLPGVNVIDVVGTNTNFIDGQVLAGFGSTYAVVNSVTVLSPVHLSVNVTMNSPAAIPTTNINVVSGLALIAQSQGSVITQQQPTN